MEKIAEYTEKNVSDPSTTLIYYDEHKYYLWNKMGDKKPELIGSLHEIIKNIADHYEYPTMFSLIGQLEVFYKNVKSE